ncbi:MULTISPECIES: ABC-F family ATP-binding cassette domain-containing protein [unclassified Leucobacter]|uniref:ABC-F family ATP-binding cassette domain-containing protein n=1 Tax=unclassified Leucobacter TaxID=2621730 RepID=UPI00165E6F05|nr:ABC-F family ATP-binding cassette domain-containing protein [Leucobacter sp. CX169]MBC9926082.1 ABC-F family ATP-binding cassette domain-containing protein [Leucobacter sp. cx-169]
MAHLLGGESLHLEFPTRVIFEGVSVGIESGDRIGIVGRNGDGKSSLLGMLSGRIEPNDGRVTVRGGTTIGVLDQADVLDPERTVRETVVGDMPEYLWAGDAKVRDVLTGLLGSIPWEATVGELSGGQRRRVALAALLTGDWDVLILDEPTNHMDIEGVAWLAGHLKTRWPNGQGGLLVVTHDRWFLDEVANETWEVHDGIVDPFEGGYAAYVLQRVERDRQGSVIEAKRQNLMKKELAWLRRGAPARTAKPKFRIEAANQLIADVPPVRDPIQLQQLAVARIGKEVVNIEEASVSFPDPNGGTREVLRNITWKLAPGERTGILGVNGAGKSTLLGLVTGKVKPTSGTVKHGQTVKISTLTQNFELLEGHMNDRVSDVVKGKRTEYNVGGKDMTPSQLLERLGFSNAQLSTPVRDLSGGQKRRLQLLLVLLDGPNVLILDEPTNDMDTDMLAAIEDLLDSWPGTLLVVSHDRYLLERVTDQQYAVLDGEFRHLPGGVDEYLKIGAANTRAGVDAGSGAAAGGAPVADGSVARVTASAPVAEAQSGPTGAERRTLEKEMQAAERRLAKLDSEIAAVHAKMAAHDPNDYEGLGGIGDKLATLRAEVTEREERWLELSELLA